MSEARRLIRFGATTVAVLLALESTVRWNEPLFAAASHRVLTKGALLDGRGTIDVLLFGTSRTWDGVAPQLLSAAVEARTGRAMPAFNLASTASSLESLEYLVDRFAARPGVRVSVVELSAPQLASMQLPWAPPVGPPADAEEWLARAVRSASRLVAHRSFLHGDNLGRLLSLLLVRGQADGSEIVPRDFVALLRGIALDPAAPNAGAEWAPERLVPTSTTSERAEASTLPVTRVLALARVFRAAGVHPVFVVPPLIPTGGPPPPEHGPEFRAMLGRIAREAPVLDFSHITVERRMFRDRTHLNAAGRRRYSQALGEALIDAGVLP